MDTKHITERLAGCHMSGCATHQGGQCDCGAAPATVKESLTAAPFDLNAIFHAVVDDIVAENSQGGLPKDYYTGKFAGANMLMRAIVKAQAAAT